MQKWYFGFCLLYLLLACEESRKPAKEIVLYESQIFKDVQLAAIFKDSKTFVDLVPKIDISELESKYLQEKEKHDFDLKIFVDQNFEDRSMKTLEFETDTTKTMYEHISLMWDKLTRGPDSVIAYSSRIALPNKYVVPGGRFQEIYYWDSYFTIEGLLADGRYDLAKDMVDNFAFLIDSIGFIPNGTRNYYKTRSQPPFFTLMVDALAKKDTSQLKNYLPQLLKEYEFWMDGANIIENGESEQHIVRIQEDVTLNRYWDKGNTPRPEAYKEDMHLANKLQSDSSKAMLYQDLRSAAASGWDFSSRWYTKNGDFGSTKTSNILPIDLNCLLHFMESTIAKAYKFNGNDGAAKEFKSKANNRKKAIEKYFWNEGTGFYHDYNFTLDEMTPELTLAGAFPLYFNLSSTEKAEQVKTVLMDKFLKDGGLVTTLKNSGQQWDAPNGWAPLQWIAVNGLLNYGYEEEAKEVMERWLALNEKVYKNTGKMMEKYNVEDLTLLSGGGEYETQDGFGWTNGVALAFKTMLTDMEVTME
ncbi:Alpha,alpha-trehalase [Flagellimonas maritima]|uniref:Alpha,alpha-trehalase n=1 Tax=Flagellimonas maritima TaxID=1383885 RepID=A0A2Z4LWF1_9FLAO|nr:alpha,alpha-trehalase TreF [Allomuricauda aurantiaca]AWX46096.1 Alpha,alpha-trehalase [Allomuricauda aurantiaca]